MHIVVVPWLAMGHIIPFHQLSICLAQRGHKVSFLSTTRNLQRLPPTPRALTRLIARVPLPLTNHGLNRLPPDAESSLDVTYLKHQLLKDAFDSAEPSVASFLASSSPDWVLTDFNSHWLPGLARRLGIRSAYFGLFTAALLAYFGPTPEVFDDGGKGKLTLEDFTAIPGWIPFKSSGVRFRPYEVAKFVQRSREYESATPDTTRFAVTLRDSDVVAMRTCPEFEPEWFDLLGKLYDQKPIVPVGFLPPTLVVEDEEKDGEWTYISEWLDKEAPCSVVYVALGTETEPSVDEVQHLALGLEKTGLPFFWALRNPPESTQRAKDMLPDGFEERVDGRGMVWTEWAPQVRILSHGSVGGFLTHCGCNSIIEGLSFGRVLILLPMINDQGLNARLMQGKNLGVEVERDESDGSFTPDSVAKAVTLAMVGEAGEPLRAAAKEAIDLFGNRKKNDHYVDEFVRYLDEHR